MKSRSSCVFKLTGKITNNFRLTLNILNSFVHLQFTRKHQHVKFNNSKDKTCVSDFSSHSNSQKQKSMIDFTYQTAQLR